MADRKVPALPKKGNGVVHHTTQIGAGLGDLAFPGLGYLLQLAVGRVVPDPLVKRREEWLEMLGAGVLELQDRFEGFDPETLVENEDFATAVHETTQIAMKTKREAKREALRNVVLNVAVGQTLDEVLYGRFMGKLDDFSEAHIVVLRILDKPAEYPRIVEAARNIYMGSQHSAIRAELDHLGIPDPLFEVVVRDLEAEGFIGNGGLKSLVSKESLLNGRTTETGKSFLRFISAPTG